MSELKKFDAFSFVVLAIIFFNALFHLTGLTELSHPLGASSTMTALTSLSVGALALGLISKTLEPELIDILHGVSFLTQALSLTLLFTNHNPGVSFFQSSSLPTSLFNISDHSPSFSSPQRKATLHSQTTYWPLSLLGVYYLCPCLY